MVHVGNDELVEILVGSNKRIGQAHGLDDVNVVIDVAVLDEQVPLQAAGHGYVRLFGVVRTDAIALIEFVPPGFVEPRVMVAGNRDAHLVEIGKRQDGMGGAVSAR